MNRLPFEITPKMRKRAEQLKQLTNTQGDSRSLGNFVIAGVGSSTFGVHSTSLKEVVGTPPITRLPNTPSWLHGLVQLRGVLMCAIDVGQIFDLRTSRQLNYLLVLESERGPLGLLVDAVAGFLEIFENDIAAKFENVTTRQDRPILHVTRQGVSLLDISKLMEIADLNRAEVEAK